LSLHCILGTCLILGILVTGVLLAAFVSVSAGWSLFAFGIVVLILFVIALCITKKRMNLVVEEAIDGSVGASISETLETDAF